ncbi:ipa protein [Chaetomidium leptoderma]|uniref:Ipa protein n=1 Tax=Chaetomidium leptoderma TaxID=669021 RepID=A0AAN6VEL4_9PEZI|nr:ipa protein [Chaetomidium leptoderma]
MEEASKVAILKELHADLARKYNKHEAAIQSFWRGFDAEQRERCVRAGAAEGVVLRHSLDPSMGNVCKIIPEWNLRDIADDGPGDFLLNLLKHRATTSLLDQYHSPSPCGPGDRDLITGMIRTRNLRHVNPYRNCYTFFYDEDENYGKSFQIRSHHAEVLANFDRAIQAGACIPQSTSELVLERQINLTQCLTILIDDILEEGSQTRAKKTVPNKVDKGASEALAKLTIRDRPAKVSLSDLIASAEEQKATLGEYLSLIGTEPVVLAHAVNIWFFSRPELVADEKGRRLPAHTDRYISSAFVEAVHDAVRGAATWDYICRLLELLKDQDANKVYRAIILQEIANVCHLEYGRAQALFKRQFQMGTGSKLFKRQSGAYDKAGNARVSAKCNPDDLARADPLLHYMMRLCQPEINAHKSVEWLKRLADFNESHPTERERMEERETDALSDLAVVVGFVQDLSPAISMPSLSRKKGQMFVARSQELEAELNELKDQIDLLDFAVPIDNLLEPGMAEGALSKLDQFIVDKMGTKMGFLYQDLVQDCFADLEKQYQQAKAKMEEQENKMDWTPIPVPAPEPREKRVEERRQKEKTRPAHSSVYEITPAAAQPGKEPSPSSKILKVSSSTAKMFSILFDKSLARGSVNWVDFEAAMADMGFSIMPKFGSVYTFLPPESLGVNKSFTVHRPHKSRIEGYMIPILSRRLKRVYGWGEGTFEVA